MADEIKLDAQDIIDALTEQRNGALNELVRAQAALRALQRNTATPPESGHGNVSRLPAQSAGE
jgi:hypothetical protein